MLKSRVVATLTGHIIFTVSLSIVTCRLQGHRSPSVVAMLKSVQLMVWPVVSKPWEEGLEGADTRAGRC